MEARLPDPARRSVRDAVEVLARRLMTKRSAVVGSAGVLTIIGGVLRASGGTSAAAGVAAYVGAGLAFSEVCCTVFRAIWTPHWKIDGIRIYLLGEVGMTAILVTLAVVQFTAAPSIYAVAFGYGIVFAFYPGLHWAIGKKVGRRPRTFYFKHKKILGYEMQAWLLGPSPDSKSYAFASRVFKARKGMSVYAALTYLVISAVFTVDAGAAGSHFIVTHRAPVITGAVHTAPKTSHTQHRNHGHSGSKQPTAPSSTQTTPAPSSSSTSVQQQLTWDDICGSVAPGALAPPWASASLYKLYLGPGGPGALVAGCPGEAVAPPQTSDFVYAVGRGAGTVLSVAVTSRDGEYPAAIFLGDAARLALNLITTDGAIGGSQRINVGGGDYYLAYSATGTSALVRASKDASYTYVPAAVVDEWYADMAVSHEWLWPEVVAEDNSTGETTFVFVSNSGDTSINNVRFSEPLNAALIDGPDGSVIEHTSFGRRMSVAEFERIPQP